MTTFKLTAAALLASGPLQGRALPGMPGGPKASMTISGQCGRVAIRSGPRGVYCVRARADGPFQARLQSVAL